MSILLTELNIYLVFTRCKSNTSSFLKTFRQVRCGLYALEDKIIPCPKLQHSRMVKLTKSGVCNWILKLSKLPQKCLPEGELEVV